MDWLGSRAALVVVLEIVGCTRSATVDDDDPSCRGDGDCPDGLACEADRCVGCIVDDDCGDALRCQDGTCVAIADLPVCAQAAGATCGDGRIDAPEECDGGSACSECRTTAPPSTWISGEGVTRLVPTDAGGALAVVGQYDDRTLRAYDADGAQVWSQPIAEQPRDLAADPVGNAYVVGSVGIEPVPTGAPWIASWDPSGAVRWSIPTATEGVFEVVAADARRVVAGGLVGRGTEARARLVSFAADGTPQWSIDEPMLAAFEGAALVDDGVAATGVRATDTTDVPELVRFDDAGALRWAIELPDDGESDGHRPARVADDGDGGTWTFGQVDGGPWAVRHDRDGVELARLDCLGSATGWVERIDVGPQGQLAIGAYLYADPPSHGSSVAWFAIVEGDTITEALRFGGQNIAANTLALRWRDDGSLVVGWTDAFDVGTANEVLVLAPR